MTLKSFSFRNGFTGGGGRGIKGPKNNEKIYTREGGKISFLAYTKAAPLPPPEKLNKKRLYKKFPIPSKIEL